MANYSDEQLFRAINTRYSDAGNVIMYYTTWMGEGYIIVGVLLSLFFIKRFRNWWYFLLALLCNLLPFFIQQSIKSYYDAPRPMQVLKGREWIHYQPEWPLLLYRGYPSGHTEGAFCFFCFLSMLLPDKHRIWGLFFFILALATGYSRVYLTAHFFSDIYLGSIVGAVTPILIYSIMTIIKERFTNKTAVSA